MPQELRDLAHATPFGEATLAGGSWVSCSVAGGVTLSVSTPASPFEYQNIWTFVSPQRHCRPGSLYTSTSAMVRKSDTSNTCVDS